MKTAEPVPLEQALAARQRLAPCIVRTPLLRLNVPDAPCEIFLKPENLQPIGSFKLRGAGNAMLQADRAELEQGVWTASTGNMAQGVAWFARELGLRCTVVAPDTAPAGKLAAIRRLGADVEQMPFDDWFQIILREYIPDRPGLFLHPVSDAPVMAGNATIGLEIIDDLPDVDAVVIPYGGGGLSCSIASVVKSLKPGVNIFACEVETAAPFKAALAAGAPTRIEMKPGFVDGIGSPCVLAEMWPLAKQLLDDSLVVSLAGTASTIRILAERNRLVAEGAGAAPVAAALAGKAGGGKVVCVVSGGNLDAAKLAGILKGDFGGQPV
jgi:threonine dehydratase